MTEERVRDDREEKERQIGDVEEWLQQKGAVDV